MSTPADPTRGIETVLLVDDNASNLQVLSQTLRDLGHRLLIAKGGEQALAIVCKKRPALILLDIMMPGMDGYEVCRRIKSDRDLSDISIVFLSALDDTADKVKGFELGAVDYITKPFQPEEVIARVQTHLKLRILERRLSERNKALEEANQRMKQDLEAAARVQQALLPPANTRFSGVRTAWCCQPCQDLAGDALNLFALDKQRLLMCVLDVCGHGVPAALLSVTVTHELRNARAGSTSARQRLRDPAGMARRLNRFFPMDSRSRLYFTLLYGILDTSAGEFAFVSAGNQGPTLLGADGRRETIDVPAVPIGLFPDTEYTTTRIPLNPGDRIYLHTDGFSEQRNPHREEFGRDRLVEHLARHRSADLAEGLETLVSAVRSWSGDDQLKDDAVILGAEYTGPTQAAP